MNTDGITVQVCLEDGSVVSGRPEGLQIVDSGTVYMTVRLPDDSLKRIAPPNIGDWSYSYERGWYLTSVL